jgi:superfamily II RNA helicase
MFSKIKIEYRLAALEEEVTDLREEIVDLKQKKFDRLTTSNWMDKLVGSISDEATFVEALEYGCYVRQSD